MKLINRLILIMACSMIVVSCIKDNGNYEYDFGNEVTLRHPTYGYTGLVNDTVKVYATRVYANPNDTLDFEHVWYINGEVYSNEPVLKFVGKELGSYSGRYYMVDKKSGIYMAVPSGFTITVTSHYQTGWGILYEKDGKSELGHIRVAGGQYFSYVDVYKKENGGEELGSQPFKIRDYPVQGGRGMFLIQYGGQGSVELDANSLRKKLVTSASFVSSQPAGFKPVDVGFYATADLIANENGDMYSRFFQNPIPFTTPWMTVPMQISKGMKVTDIWDSWSGNMAYAFMHDKLNNRVLYVRLDAPNVAGGIAVVDTMPLTTPDTLKFPPNWANLNRMGSWEYIWGGTFLDGQYTAAGAMLLRNPIDQQVYLQMFNSRSANRILQWSPKSVGVFPGGSLLTQNTRFVALKSREYLFFTSGTTNNKLYYYDVKSGGAVKLYKEFDSPIKAITASDDSNQIAVGLESGTFILHDVTATSMINNTAPELHRLSGLGKVVDIIVKGGNMR